MIKKITKIFVLHILFAIFTQFLDLEYIITGRREKHAYPTSIHKTSGYIRIKLSVLGKVIGKIDPALLCLWIAKAIRGSVY